MMEHCEQKRRLSAPTTWAGLLILLSIAASLGRFYFGNLCELLSRMALAPLIFACGGLLLYTLDWKRNRVIYLVLALVCWFFCSIAINEKFQGTFLANRPYLENLSLYLLVCFPLGLLLCPRERHRLIASALAFSVGILAVMSAVGLAAAFTGNYWTPGFEKEFGIGIYPNIQNLGAYQRLTIFCYPNAVGMMSALGLLLAAYGALTIKKRWGKVLYLLAMLPLYGALALSVSRTAMFAAALGLGLMAFRLGLLCLKVKRALLRVLLASILACAVLLAVFFGCHLVVDLAAAEKTAPVEQQATTAASEAVAADGNEGGDDTKDADGNKDASIDESAAIAHRPIATDIGRLTGRTDVWLAALETMEETPRLFLIGSSPSAVGNVVAERMLARTNNWYQELHNSFIQIGFSCGLPMLLLFVLLLVLLLVRCCRAFFSGKPEYEEIGYLPPILAAILLIGFMETFLLVYPDVYFANIWFFLIAGCLCSASATAEK